MIPVTEEEIDIELAVAREALAQDDLPYSDRALARLLASKICLLKRSASAGLLRLPPGQSTRGTTG